MTINVTKKVCLFLSIVSVYLPILGMKDNASYLDSKLVLSQGQRKIAAVLLPLTIAGTVLVANNKEYVSSLFKDVSLPLPDNKIMLGISTVTAMPLAYLFMHRLTSEEQFKKCKAWYDKNKTENIIIKNKSDIQTILIIKDAQEKKDKLREFVNINFSEKADKEPHPSVIAVKELCALGVEIKREENRMKKIQNKEGSFDIEYTSFLAILDDLKKMVQQMRGEIISLEGYEEQVSGSIKAKNTNLKEQKLTFVSKIASFVPMFVQPVSTLCMVLLQMLFAKIGIE